MPENRCPSCGAPLPAHALDGHCPRCMLLQGLEGEPPGPDGGSSAGATELPPKQASVLETLGATVGHVPRVLLRDTAPGEEPSPIVRPMHDEEPSIRYRIDGEIARGGMGAILKGRDPDIGRDVAIKVLRHDLRDNGDLVRRFVEEAQIGGQLQHPGVVPIYELGTFADKRPFFSMKLVKGQTLADLLAARTGPTDDLPRLLSIYAAIAQTMAYSHTRGVIHRDLKPSNVMVGSFGEVQVMDWGLAKVLPRGGVVADAKAGKEPPQETLIATARSGSDKDLSHAGSILGTPSYMPPEQARGETDLINDRADVFALGSILAEILTGSPAFTGQTSTEILRKAARGATADALTRLDGCGAEAELIALTRDCLAVEPEHRPHDARVVADRITAHLASVQERAHAAERERAVAVARAAEERRRRKVQLALAASVLALTTLGGLSTTYFLQQRQARAAAGQRVIDRVTTLLRQAVAQPEDIPRWEVALAAVEEADPAGDPNTRAQLLALHEEVQAGLKAARDDKALLDRLVDIRSAEADDEDGSLTDHDYANAFDEAGIDVANRPPADAGAKIKARSPSLAMALAGALDDWAAIRQGKQANAAGAARLREAARIADPDPWRIKLRTALDQADKAARRTALQALAKEAKYDELGPISLHLLGTGLNDASDDPRAESARLAESVLRAAQQRHPRDVWVNFALGAVLERLSRRDEAIRFYTAARMIRPETAHQLAHALEKRGDSNEALAVFRDLKRLRPDNAWHLGCLGRFLSNKGMSQEADEVFEAAVAAGRAAVRLKPDRAEAHSHLGYILMSQGKGDEAVAEFREAIRLKPDHANAHHQIGDALHYQIGKRDESIAAYRAAIRLKPDDAGTHSCLGKALKNQGKLDEAIAEFREAIRLQPDLFDAQDNLGNALKDQGKLDEAIALFRDLKELRPGDASCLEHLAEALEAKGLLREADETFAAAVTVSREAVRLRPDDYNAHINLGHALQSQGKMYEGGAEYGEAQRLDPKHAPHLMDSDRVFAIWRRAVRLNPDYAEAHYQLGNHLRGIGQRDKAIAEFKEAIRLKPDHTEVYSALVPALTEQGKLDEVVAAYREAIRLKPDTVEGHLTLGGILRARGDTAGALVMLRRGYELASKQPGWRRPSAEWVADAERQPGLAQRLTAVLKGEAIPKDNAERLALVRMCQETTRFAAAARLLAEALESDPKLGEDLRAAHRHHATGLAGLAGAGLSADDPRPDQAARDRFRTQARDWFRADLALCSKKLDTGKAEDRVAVVQALQHWRWCKDLFAIREAAALAELPEPERKEWQSLWADVDALLKRPQGPAVNALLGDLRRAGNGPLADELTQEIQQAQAEVAGYGNGDPDSTGHVIVGRVICEAGDDPSRVVAQMRIHSEGYFVGPVKESGRPVGFRRQGYLPAQITPSGQPGSVEYVGEVRLQPMTKKMGSAVRGKVVLDGEIPAAPVTATLSLGRGPINTPSGGTRGSYDSFDANVSSSGEFSASGLSPTDYDLHISAPGSVSQSRTFTLKPGKTHDAGTIALERATQVAISYRVASRPPFTKASPERETVVGGGRFRANWPDSQNYYSDLMFPQDNGKIRFRAGYYPCSIADLGPGKVEDFLGVDPTSAKFTDPGKVVPQSGHVYLLDHQQSGNHWVLFKIESEQKAPRSSGRP